MVEELPKPVEQTKAPEKAPEFNIDELNNEIEAANKKLVSQEMAKIIAIEKENAKREAEKEFLVNQKIKDKEREIEEMRKVQLERERAASEQLEALRRRVDELAASKQTTTVQNPFAGTAPSKSSLDETSNSILSLKENELEEVEQASFYALRDRKV